jgi:pimeloyl-ACP methyl ester carboxylesterase
MPQRVAGMALAAPVAPFEAVDTKGALSAKLGHRAVQNPLVCNALFGHLVAAARRHPDRLPLLVRLETLNMGPADRAFFNDPVDRRLFFDLVDEAFRQGTTEVVRAIQLMTDPWADWLRDVPMKVKIFQGGADHVVTPAMSRGLAALLPCAEFTFLPNEGHMTLPRNHAADILAAALSPT